MATLNREFLNHEGRTDVLTFDLRQEGRADPEAVLAEIYVCPQVAREAALRYNTLPSWELVFYVVHGMLHLCGWNDAAPEEMDAMHREQRRIMAVLEQENLLAEFLPPRSQT
jgi:probable rRNA maturation factor